MSIGEFPALLGISKSIYKIVKNTNSGQNRIFDHAFSTKFEDGKYFSELMKLYITSPQMRSDKYLLSLAIKYLEEEHLDLVKQKSREDKITVEELLMHLKQQKVDDPKIKKMTNQIFEQFMLTLTTAGGKDHILEIIDPEYYYADDISTVKLFAARGAIVFILAVLASIPLSGRLPYMTELLLPGLALVFAYMASYCLGSMMQKIGRNPLHNDQSRAELVKFLSENIDHSKSSLCARHVRWGARNNMLSLLR